MEPAAHVRDAATRIQIEYVEMPNLRLTARQVQRLWSLPEELCDAVLALLMRKGFLTLAADGAYVRHCVTRERLAPASPMLRAS
jgi:hypothetical protein